MRKLAPSLKATGRRRETEDDPIAGLKRAQDDYKAARSGYRKRQRQILQDVYRSVSDLIDDDEACAKFMKRKEVAKFAGHDGDPHDTDRGDIWFQALAYVYHAKLREGRKRASKHASALRLLYAENIDAEQIATTIKERGGIQKLADEAANRPRSGAKKRADEDDADPSAEKGEASDDTEAQSTDEDDVERDAENGKDNNDDAEEGAHADQRVRFSISEKLMEKIIGCRGNRVKIIALVPKKKHQQIKVLKVVKLQ